MATETGFWRRLLAPRRDGRGPTAWSALALAAVVVAFAAGVRIALGPVLGDAAPLATFFAAVAVAGWYGGLRSSLAATGLGLAASLSFQATPSTAEPSRAAILALFLAVALLITAVIELLHRERRHSAELEARERERRQLLQTTLRSIEDGVITTDREGRVTFLNPRAEILTGAPLASAEGLLVEAVYRVADTPAGERNPVHDLLAGRVSEQPTRERVLTTAMGRLEHVEESAAPIRDEEGGVVGAVLVFRSVEWRRSAERERRRLERRLESLIDNTPLAVIEWDRASRIRRWSGEARAIFGWSAEEAVGRTLQQLGVVYEGDTGIARHVLRRLRGRKARDVATRIRNRTRNGDVRQCEWYNSVVRDDGGRVQAVLSLVLDVTEREQLESTLREADRRKDEFLATLAHELRNPLAPMRNALEIMRLAGHDSGAAERARALIERQLGQMVRLIDDLLDVSRISLGKLELRRQTISIAEVVAAAIETSRPVIEASSHELLVSLPKEPLHVDGDVTRLTQVLVNLLDNAARYMEPGGRVRLLASREDGSVVLRVRDGGIGIAPGMLPHIFTMYTQGSRFLHRSEAGLGVGLTLVQKLVEMHGGKIEATSEGLGKGSEFVVRLPAVAPPPPPPRPAARRDAPVPRRHVLVVDDNVDAADSLATMLQMMGHDTQTAHDGPAALESAARLRPEVILLDIGMPGMSGYEVASRIRQLGWGQHMNLVALTGWGQEEDRRRSREAGFDHHLVKPVHPDALAALLAELPAFPPRLES